MQAALTTWQHMVLLASKAPTSGSPASNAAKRSLFSGVVTPVLQLLLHVPPGALTQQGNHQGDSLWSQVCLLHSRLFGLSPAEGSVGNLGVGKRSVPVCFGLSVLGGGNCVELFSYEVQISST